MKQEIVLNAEQIEAAVQQLTETILAKDGDGPWAVVGIRRGGENLARRLAKRIQTKTGQEPPLGMVDITLYRDDGFGPNDWPEIGPTKIGFELKSHTVILVDDVLFTGRTVRAAIDALLDYGRPKALRLAVLVDRGLRELPVRGDAVGVTLTTRHDQHVDCVVCDPPSAEDAVYLRQLAAEAESRPT